jgi:hypothetical protein
MNKSVLSLVNSVRGCPYVVPDVVNHIYVNYIAV